MFLKSSLLGNVALLLASLFLYGQWQLSEKNLTVSQANYNILEKAKEEQDTTIEDLREQNKQNIANISNLIGENTKVNTQYIQTLNEITDLRERNYRDALQKPYEAGNLAVERFNNRLCRIATCQDNNVKSRKGGSTSSEDRKITN